MLPAFRRPISTATILCGWLCLALFLFPLASACIGEDGKDWMEQLARREWTQGDKSLKYRILEPARATEPLPVVLFLHGAGERGDDNTKQLVHGVSQFVSKEAQEKHPCYVIVPQCPAGRRWVEVDWSADQHDLPETSSDSLALAVAIVRDLIEQKKADPTRIYITGLSMGGYGTWDAIARYPDLFAAAVPICGGGDPKTAPRFKQLPVWCFHGGRDGVVKPERSREMVKALEQSGGKPKYTEYPEAGHDSWTATYANPELHQWLFEQRLGANKPNP
ncbi:MAG: prolyl oligopeptidase family serine peptidase [Pirellulaceae bacterium]